MVKVVHRTGDQLKRGIKATKQQCLVSTVLKTQEAQIKQQKMNFFTVLMVSLAVTAAVMATPVADEKLEKATGATKLDMKEVEKLLQEIEAQEQKPKPDDATVSESVNKLFTTFRQMTSAYINVLNAVNKSLGLPKYPAIPGLSRQARQSQQGGTLPLRQIQQNLSQLQTAAVEVGSLVRRVVTNMSQDSRNTVLNQFRRFTDMWSKQLNEISGMLENVSTPQARQNGPIDNQTVFDQINRYIQQVTSSIRDFANSVYRRVVPTSAPSAQIAGASF